MTPSADESAAILTKRIRAQEPTLFVRFGDGAIECVNGASNPKTPWSADGELYSVGLAADIIKTMSLINQPDESNIFFGDWRTAESLGSKPQRIQEWIECFEPYGRNLLHFEALLLMRQSEALLDFYRAVAEDKRRKLYIGPAGNWTGARMMRAEMLTVPDRMLPSDVPWCKAALDRQYPEVVLFGAGLVGHVLVIQHWVKHQHCTYISLGSALDPLGRGRTRSNQLPKAVAEKFLKELL